MLRYKYNTLLYPISIKGTRYIHQKKAKKKSLKNFDLLLCDAIHSIKFAKCNGESQLNRRCGSHFPLLLPIYWSTSGPAFHLFTESISVFQSRLHLVLDQVLLVFSSLSLRSATKTEIRNNKTNKKSERFL